ncbi:MAG: tetratricopeptide repeat protein [Rubricoccaceae bacterium]|nr:tetratricopeptide repeat protein [Rubricoccaceae bacterium]
MSAARPPDPSPAGDPIGRYRLLGPLGQGGMGVVFRAEDPRLGRQVALKLLPEALSGDADAKARLEAEARAASALDHPHICTVYEIGETGDDRLYIAMACYEGQTLADRLDGGGALPIDEAVEIARQLASGLAAAHRKGIVHRDLKPSNVFLCEEDGVPPPQAKILDFGVAKVEGMALTRPGATLGTIEYAAPEQAHGEVDARSDLWALGVVLYEMLAGRRPFTGSYDAALLYAILNEAPAPLHAARPDVPEALEALVLRLLEKDPADRYQTAEAVEAALAGAGAGDAAREAPTRAGPRPRWLGAAAGVALALVLLGALWALRGADRPGIPDQMHIAILPFATGEGKSAAFADGLVEVLANELTQLEQHQGALWVVPVSEVRAQGIASAAEAHRALGATLVVTGSVQRGAERLRIPLNLVDATTLRQLRATTLDAPLTDLDALQTQVLAAIEAMLDLAVQPEVERRLAEGGTDSGEAYEHYLSGLGYLQRHDVPGNTGRAVEELQAAVAADASFALAHAALGEAYWLQFRESQDPAWMPRAEAAALRAAALAPGQAAPAVLLARLRVAAGEPGEALEAARRALTLEPNNAGAHRVLGAVLAARGDLDGAEEAYREAVRLQPDAWGAHEALAVFYYDYGRYDEALAAYREVVRLIPDSPRGYNGLGAAHLFLGQYDEAQAVYERARAIRPTDEVLSNLGYIHYTAGRYAEAAASYEEALALDSTDYEVWGNLAGVYSLLPARQAEVLDAYRGAIRRAEAVRAVTPDDPLLLSLLAGYYVEVGAPARAQTLLEQALALDPENVTVAFDAALVYEELGDRAAALEWLGRALEGGVPLDWVEGEEALDALRADPRYAALRAAG